MEAGTELLPIQADPLKLAHDAFDRMRRAHRRGTGCHLTAEMIRTLSVTFLGQVWEEDRPEAALKEPTS